MFSYCSNSGDFRYGNPGMSASDSGIKCADGFPSYYCDDYTDRMDAIMEEWKKMDFYPDGIYTGFLADARQADKAVEFIEQFAKEDTKILIDPVMGIMEKSTRFIRRHSVKNAFSGQKSDGDNTKSDRSAIVIIWRTACTCIVEGTITYG